MAEEINVLEIFYDEKIKEIIRQLLEKNPDEPNFYFEKDEKAGIPHSVVILRRFSNSRPKERVYEMVILDDSAYSKQSGNRGSFGQFISIVATIKLDPFIIKVYPEAFKHSIGYEIGRNQLPKWVRLESKKSRGVKIFSSTGDLAEAEATKEAKIAKDSPLKSKQPGWWIDDAPCIVMRQLGDMVLYDLVYRRRDITLKPIEKFELFVLLLKHYIEQFIKKNRIHGDIKPENICVSLKPMEVWMVDYGFAKKIEGEGRKGATGTEGYCAPELFKSSNNSKTDIYSLAISAIELFAQARHDRFCQAIYEGVHYLNHLRAMLNPVVMEIDLMFSGSLKEAVLGLLRSMLEIKPKERLDPSTLETHVLEIELLLKEVQRNNQAYERARDKPIDDKLIKQLYSILNFQRKQAANLSPLSPSWRKIIAEFATEIRVRVQAQPNLSYRKLELFLERHKQVYLEEKLPSKDYLTSSEKIKKLAKSVRDLLNSALMEQYEKINLEESDKDQIFNQTPSSGN